MALRGGVPVCRSCRGVADISAVRCAGHREPASADADGDVVRVGGYRRVSRGVFRYAGGRSGPAGTQECAGYLSSRRSSYETHRIQLTIRR